MLPRRGAPCPGGWGRACARLPCGNPGNNLRGTIILPTPEPKGLAGERESSDSLPAEPKDMDTRTRGFAALAAAGLVFCACEGEAPGPEPEAAEPLSPLEGLRVDTVATVGAPEGQPWEAFGGIWEVAAAPDGRFAVLDIEAGAVHVYDATGAHLGSVAEAGLEPGQLRRATGLAWNPNGELLVWDPGGSWVSSFTVSPDGVSFSDRQPAYAFGETGFCALDDRIYLSYLLEDQVVHEINAEGVVARSFSQAPAVAGIETIAEDLRALAREELTPSRLLCLADRILEVSYFQSRIQLHDSEGSLVWSREVDEFSPVVAYSPDDMGVGLRYAEGSGSHLSRSVVPWGVDRALLQYELRTPGPRPAGADYESLESRLIRLDTGEEVDRTRGLPLFLAGYGDRLYQVRQLPFPQVLVLEGRD